MVNHAALKAAVFNVSTAGKCTIAMEEQTVIVKAAIGGLVIVILTTRPPVSAIRAIAKTPTGRNFAPKAVGPTLVLR